MTYNPRINNLDGNVVQVSGTLSTKLSRVKGNIVKVTGSTQLDVTNYAVLADASNTNLTLTLPPASDVPGLNYKIKKIDSDKEPAYVYEPSTFKQQQVLSGSLAQQSSDRFGASVALNALGDIALIGAHRDETGSNGTPDAMGLSYIFRSGSTGWKEEAILSGSLATVSNDNFGISVALNAAGNIALVGAYQDETGSNGTPASMGLSYIFRSGSTGWKEEAILSGSLATGSFDYFGISVALNAAGNIALVGAYQDETGSNGTPDEMGLSYIFRSGSTGWKEEAILSGSLATGSGDQFGWSVALNASGNIVLIGARSDETGSNGLSSGTVYIFTSGSTGWQQETILSGSLATGSADFFGWSVALNAAGDIALVGAYSDETGSDGTPAGMGLSYIFRSGSTGWREEAILSGSLATGSGDSFGWSVALNALGDIALIGAYWDETGSNGTPDKMGLSYVFTSGSTGWKEETILSGSLATGSADFFGYSVALNAAGNIALVGAYQDETGSNGTPDGMGLSYIFQSDLVQTDSGIGLVKLKGSPIPEAYDFTSYTEKVILSGSLATGSFDYFGRSVALNAAGNIALIGAIQDETGSNGTPNAMGLSYIFRSGSTGWKEEAILSGSLATGSNDYFGEVVALNAEGNIALVGAYNDETGSDGTPNGMGLSYIFRSGSTGWKEEAILSGSLATGSGDRFGWSVTLNAAGNIALVGAYNDETGSNGTPNGMGLAYIFTSGSTGWKEEAILSGSLATGSNDYFGISVALNASGNIALIGAVADETGSDGTPDGMGLSYIFTSGSTGWKQEAILSGSLATGSADQFGNSVALNSLGDIALIGAYFDETGSDGTPNAMGLSYIFTSGSTGWKQEAILSGSLAIQASDNFGISVALNAAGNIALIGAYNDETGSNGTPDAMGLSYIFRSGSTGWKQEAILSGSLATGSADFFGWSVALNAAGNIALIGAYNDETGSDGTPNAMGLSYIFEANLQTEQIDNTSSVNITTQYETVEVISNGSGSWKLF